MTAFDETLFRVVPRVYRALDQALRGRGPGRAPRRSRRSCGSAAGSARDRDGNPFVTAQVTRETAVIQAEHVLRALENATTRIGRALTVHADAAPPCAGFAVALAAAATAHPELLAEITARSPQRAVPHVPALPGPRGSRRPGCGTRDLAYRRAAEFLADLRLVQPSLAAAGATRQAYGELQHLIWQAETFGFHLAEPGGPPAQRGARPRAAPSSRAGGALSAQTGEVLATFRAMAWIQDRFGVDACRRYVVSFTRSAADIAAVYELAAPRVPRAAPPPVLDVVPLFESGDDLANATRVLDEMLRARAGPAAAGRDRAAAGGHARLLRLGQGARPGQRDAAAVRRAGAAGPVGGASTTCS